MILNTFQGTYNKLEKRTVSDKPGAVNYIRLIFAY